MENRRRYPRYGTELEARLYTADLNLSVRLVDLSEKGIGIISEKPMDIGSKVSLSLFPIIENPIIGIAVWSVEIEKDQEYYYRIGIETESLALKKLKVFGFPINSEFESEIISQNNITAQKD